MASVIGTVGSRRDLRLAAAPEVRVVLASLGLACCALEVESAVRMGLLVDDRAAGPPDDPPDHTVLLVAGTVTDALAPAVQSLIAELPPGTSVVSFGACAGTGGPYWDAPTVTKGVDQVVPVARYVPGCPPSPDALVAGLRALADQGRGDA